MNRREFVKTGALGLAAAASAAAGRPEATKPERNDDRSPAPEDAHRAAVCGLFCDACSTKAEGHCHGCGCECGKCAASNCRNHCSVYACAKQRGLMSCADCKELPCSKLIMHACDPLSLGHAPCIENLRRRRTIGTKKWIEEQEAYWADEDNLKKGRFAEGRSQAAVRDLKESTGYKKLW